MSTAQVVRALPLDHSSTIHQNTIVRAAKWFGCPDGAPSKALICCLQTLGIYYVGCRMTQMGPMKSQEREAKTADRFCRFGAAGTLRFVQEKAGLDLPRGMTVKMLGKNTMQATGEVFFDPKDNKAHLKFQETRRQCKILTDIWEKVKPKDGKIPSGKQEWDYIVVFLLAIWENEQDQNDEKHKSDQLRKIKKSLTDSRAEMEAADKKDDGGDSLKKAAMVWATASAAAKQGPKKRNRLPCPKNWLPVTFLTWLYFGPLSKNPDPILCLQASGGVPKQEVWETGEAEPAAGADSKGGLGSASAVQLINYNGSQSRRQLQKQKREARQEEKEKAKDEDKAKLVSIMQEGGNQMGQLVGVMRQLVPGNTAPAAASAGEQANTAAGLLERMEVMAKQANDDALASKLRKERMEVLMSGYNVIKKSLGGGGRSVFDVDNGGSRDVVDKTPKGNQDAGGAGAGERDWGSVASLDIDSGSDLELLAVEPVVSSARGKSMQQDEEIDVTGSSPSTASSSPADGEESRMTGGSDPVIDPAAFDTSAQPLGWSPDYGTAHTLPGAANDAGNRQPLGQRDLNDSGLASVIDSNSSSGSSVPSLGWSPEYGTAHTLPGAANNASNRQPLGQQSLNDPRFSAAHFPGATRKRDEAEGAHPPTPAPAYRTPEFRGRMPGISGSGGGMPSYAGFSNHSYAVRQAMEAAAMEGKGPTGPPQDMMAPHRV